MILEAKDIPQYLKDSAAYVEKIGRDTLYYQGLIKAWEASEDYQKHIQKLKEWQKSAAFAAYNTFVLDSIAKILKGLQKQDAVDSLQTLIDEETDTLKRYQHYGVLIDTLKKRLQIRRIA